MNTLLCSSRLSSLQLPSMCVCTSFSERSGGPRFFLLRMFQRLFIYIIVYKRLPVSCLRCVVFVAMNSA